MIEIESKNFLSKTAENIKSALKQFFMGVLTLLGAGALVSGAQNGLTLGESTTNGSIDADAISNTSKSTLSSNLSESLKDLKTSTFKNLNVEPQRIPSKHIASSLTISKTNLPSISPTT